MTKIAIHSLADYKRAFAIPGLIVWTERNDVRGPSTVRNALDRAALEAPLTVHELRATQVIFSRDGCSKALYHDFPKARDLVADGTNIVSFRLSMGGNTPTGSPLMITYRLEHPDSPLANVPSGALAKLYPMLTEEQMASEEAEKERIRAEKAAHEEAYLAAIAERSARPKPPVDPRFAELEVVRKAAYHAAVARGVTYTDAINTAVIDAIAGSEFATPAELPAITMADTAVTDHYLQRMDLRQELAAHPRGTWVRVFEPLESGELRQEGWISLGNGEMHVRGPFTRTQGYADLYRAALSDANYTYGREIEAKRKAETEAAENEAVANITITVGTILTNIPAGKKTFIRAVVSAVDHDKAEIHLTGMQTSRTSKSYDGKISALNLHRLQRQGRVQVVPEPSPAKPRSIKRAVTTAMPSLF